MSAGFDLQQIIERLADFYGADEAQLWMFSRQKILDGKIRAELVHQGHANQVLKVIGQIEEGVYI